MKNMNLFEFINNFYYWSKAYLDQKIVGEKKVTSAGVEHKTILF